MTDTPPEFEARYGAMLRALSPERRIAMMLSMNRTARRIVWSSLPDGLTPVERRAAFLRRFYGDEITPEAVAAVAHASTYDPSRL